MEIRMYKPVSMYEERNRLALELPFIFLTPIDFARRKEVEINMLIKLKLAISNIRIASEIKMNTFLRSLVMTLSKRNPCEK